MTRNPPQGSPQEGYQGSESSGYQQAQYGEDGPAFGSYAQAYGQIPNYRPSSYGYDGRDAAQYDRPYQEYPPESYDGYGDQGYQQRPASHMLQTGSGDQYPPPQEFPPSGQQYPSPPRYGSQPPLGGSTGDDVNEFKSHYEQPYAPIDPATGQPADASADDERGLMGALAGGVAGAYGGHKVHHGFLGGIGGAVAGSMLEDAYKKHKKEEAKHKRHGSRSSSSSSDSDDGREHHGHDTVMAGNFAASSRHVRLEGSSTLTAECANLHGHHHESSIDLNDCLTNTNGKLLWARGGNFAASSRHIRLTDNGVALEAELGDGRGGWQHNKVWLNERITNDNGRLEMI